MQAERRDHAGLDNPSLLDEKYSDFIAQTQQNFPELVTTPKLDTGPAQCIGDEMIGGLEMFFAAPDAQASLSRGVRGWLHLGSSCPRCGQRFRYEATLAGRPVVFLLRPRGLLAESSRSGSE